MIRARLFLSLMMMSIALATGCAGPRPSDYFAERAPETGWVARVWDSRISLSWLAPLSSHMCVEVRSPQDPPGRGEIFEVWGWGDSRIVRTPPPNAPLEGTLLEEDERRRLVSELRGDKARAAVLWIRSQVRAYNENRNGHVHVAWPGPNSNTFIANLIREAPGLRADLPPTAAGKDFAGLTPIRPTTTGTGLSLDVLVVGVQLGLEDGVEAHVLGMTFGVSFWPPALKLPCGRIGVPYHVATDAGSESEPETGGANGETSAGEGDAARSR